MSVPAQPANSAQSPTPDQSSNRTPAEQRLYDKVYEAVREAINDTVPNAVRESMAKHLVPINQKLDKMLLMSDKRFNANCGSGLLRNYRIIPFIRDGWEECPSDYNLPLLETIYIIEDLNDSDLNTYLRRYRITGLDDESRDTKDVKAITALVLDGSAVSLDALSELYILREAASRWAFDSELDLRGDEVRPNDMFDIIGGTGMGGFYTVLFTRLNCTIGQVIQAHHILEERLFASGAWISEARMSCVELFQTVLDEIVKELRIGISLDSPLEEKGPSSKGFVCVVNSSAVSNCRLLRSYRSRRAQGPPCTIREALQATLSNDVQLPAVQIEEEVFLSALGIFPNPTRVLTSELQNVFPNGSNVACLVSLGAGHSNIYPFTQGVSARDVFQPSQLVADEFARQCHELGRFFFRFSLPTAPPFLTGLKETYSQLKGTTMAYLDSHGASTMLDGLAEALIERAEVVPLERLGMLADYLNFIQSNRYFIGSLAGRDGQSQLMARIHEVREYLDDSLFRDIDCWLQPIQQTSKLDLNIQSRGETTCQWILENPIFIRWVKAGGGLFWYHGLMGTGKTMTVSFLTQRFLEDTNIHVAYYYFEFTNPATLSEEALLRSVIAQLALAAPEVIRALHQKHSGGAHQPQLATLQTALRDLVSISRKPVFIVIDALDEFPAAQRKYLLQSLLAFCNSESTAQLHIMTTSREDRDIYAAFEDLEYQLSVQGDLVRQDIAAFVNQQLADKKWAPWPKEEVDKMRRILNERADGQFRMVACQIDILMNIKTSGKLHESLHSLPTTLANTYEYILDQIPVDLRPAARQLFAILSFTDELISMFELCALVAVDFGDENDLTQMPLFCEKNIFHDPLDLLDVGTSFVSQTTDWEQRLCLQLAHASVKEYILVGRSTWYALQEGPTQHLIASSCLAVLHHFRVLEQSDRRTPFEYSRNNWFKHVFPDCPHVLLSQQQQIYEAFPWPKRHLYDPGYHKNALLESAASFCLLDFLETRLIMNTWSEEILGSTLIAASGSRRPKLLALQSCYLLLLHGAKADYCGNSGSALHAASQAGNLEVIQLLLKKGADVNATGGGNGTALHIASQYGNMEVVEFLVKHGADINAIGGKYGTALQAVAKWGNLKVTQLLVKKGADVNAIGGKYGTALQAATHNGNLEVAYFLVENGADDSTMGGEYGTALQAVAKWGSLEVVRHLVEKGADVKAMGGKYGTALQAAAHYGNLDVVCFLVDRGADVNAIGGKHGTAVQAASWGEGVEVLQFLVENGANLNAVGGMHGTALHAAVNWESLNVVQFLVAKGANVNAVASTLKSPLDWARDSRSDRKEVIERYLIGCGAKTYEELMAQTYIHPCADEQDTQIERGR
ncbi:hypothetical protein DL96DRAFT_1810582 [Flagelloscypha sp. PMI_526]|nr:hypothetical protein DL96DRAFT_1810582 [Flagelloscypha sp. PMI_526]